MKITKGQLFILWEGFCKERDRINAQVEQYGNSVKPEDLLDKQDVYNKMYNQTLFSNEVINVKGKISIPNID